MVPGSNPGRQKMVSPAEKMTAIFQTCRVKVLSVSGTLSQNPVGKKPLL
jgi:hypothetical protein